MWLQLPCYLVSRSLWEIVCSWGRLGEWIFRILTVSVVASECCFGWLAEPHPYTRHTCFTAPCCFYSILDHTILAVNWNKRINSKKRNWLLILSFKALLSNSDLSGATAIPASVSTDILLRVTIHIAMVRQRGPAHVWLFSLWEPSIIIISK